MSLMGVGAYAVPNSDHANEPPGRAARPAAGAGHRRLLRSRRTTGARARSGRSAPRGQVRRHRPHDPRLARRARQLPARRPDRRAHPLERCRRRDRDERRGEVPARPRHHGHGRLAAVPRARGRRVPPGDDRRRERRAARHAQRDGSRRAHRVPRCHRGRQARTGRDVPRVRGRGRRRVDRGPDRQAARRDRHRHRRRPDQVQVGRRRTRLRRVHRLQVAKTSPPDSRSSRRRA